MRQNRRRYARTSPFNHRVMALVTMIGLIAAVGGLSKLSIKNAASRTGDEIARLEREYKAIRAERIRAEARWSACTRPERLDAALASHGLKMTLARGEKIVSLRGGRAADSAGLGATEVAANGPVSR